MANYKILAGLSIVVGLVGIIFLSLLYSLTGGDIPFDYGVIMDAGSSHSEALLYQWKGDKYKGTGYVIEIDTCSVDDGISSFANPEDAGESLIPCLHQVAGRVPEEKRKDTPVYLAATAGMRILNISNPYLNLATFTAIKCAIPRSGMDRKEVGIISGQDEGIFAWITSNFLLGNLQSKIHPTVGALDMGGASTQISFEVDEQYKDAKNVKTLRLYGETYHVFSVTYLCYGAFELYRRYLASLIDSPDTTETAESPCHHTGWTFQNDANFFFNQPCTEIPYLRQWVFLNEHKLNKTYTIKGTSDPVKCREKMAVLFDPAECGLKEYKECFQPITDVEMDDNIKFMAFSSFYYTIDFLKAGNKSLETYRKDLSTFCGKNWAEVNATDYPKNVRKVLERFCMQGFAVDVILTQGYKFNETVWETLTFTSKINKTSVGWALGYMINSTNAIPEESVEPAAISLTVFIILLLVCVILLGVGFFFCSKGQKKSSRPIV